MSFKYEHYKTSGDSLTTSKYLYRLLQLLAVIFFILLNVTETTAINEPVQAAKITIQNNTIKKHFIENPKNVFLETYTAKFKNKIIYFSSDFDVNHMNIFQTNEMFSANKNGYIIYKKISEKIIAFNKKGNKTFEYKTKTYPRAVRTGNFYFLFTGDQSGIGFLRKNGHLSGTYKHFTSLITGYAYADKPESAYLGFLDGSIKKYNIPKAKIEWEIRKKNSSYPFVKGLAISKDEKTVAVLNGLNPEIYTLLSSSGKSIWSFETGGLQRTKTYIYVGNHYCFGHTKNRIYLINKSSGSSYFSSKPVEKFHKKIIHSSFDDCNITGKALFSYSTGNYTTVKLINKYKYTIFTKVYKSPYAFVSFMNKGNSFVIQTDEQIDIFKNANSI